ncbi:MAG: hypothetical protein R3D28_00020, partial [Geminicoccaceae bacterium]
ETEDAQADYQPYGESADYADGEWVVDEATGEQMWQPADGSDPISLDEWNKMNADAEAGDESEGGEEAVADEGATDADDSAADADTDGGGEAEVEADTVEEAAGDGPEADGDDGEPETADDEAGESDEAT